MAARVRTADDDQEIAKIRVITQVSSAAYQRSGPPAKILAQRWAPVHAVFTYVLGAGERLLRCC